MPPPPLKLHWSPVEASWLVALGLVVLAVLPHQIPKTGRDVMKHPIGMTLFIAAAAGVTWLKPVVGIAMFLLLAGVLIYGPHHTVEAFTQPTLNKDHVPKQKKSHRWFDEEVLSEMPDVIQERTEDPSLLYDKVTRQESGTWLSENTLDEQPEAIQERPVMTDAESD